jgi:hypothetical protein
MVMEKSPLFISSYCLLPSILSHSFAIRFICPSHRHSSYCILPTVHLVSSSVIEIGSLLFTDPGYPTTEVRTRIYRIYSLQRYLLMGYIWPIPLNSSFSPRFDTTETMCSDHNPDFMTKFNYIWQYRSKNHSKKIAKLSSYYLYFFHNIQLQRSPRSLEPIVIKFFAENALLS